MTKQLCIFGFGYTANTFAELYANTEFQIIGTSRQPEKLAAKQSPNCRLLPFSAKTFAEFELKPSHLLVSTPPSEAGDPTLIEFEDYLSKISPSLKTIIYLSTTGVYGDHQGAWVDESAEPNHPGPSGLRRLEAEKDWLSFASKHQIPLYILRLAGIYGPDRNALKQLKQGKAFTVFKEDLVFSRIHVEDIAKIIMAALSSPEKAGIYNLCDSEPASNTVIDAFAAHLLAIPAPPLLPFEQAKLQGMALEFYQSSKRVSNQKLREALGIELTYPSYREGLSALFKKGQY